MERKRGVSNWQSMKCQPKESSICAKLMRASFEALGTNENMLSPKKALRSVTP